MTTNNDALIARVAPIVHPDWTGPVPQPWGHYDPDDFLCAPKVFADGRTAWAMPVLFGGRLAVSPHPLAPAFDDHWCYNSLGTLAESRAACVRALLAWDGTGEPAGWMKHSATGRFRDGGDPLQEYLAGSKEEIERSRARFGK